MVIVNTVVIVKGMGRSQGDVALALAAYGGGSMLAALALPRVLQHIADRTVMLVGAAILTVTLGSMAGLALDWPLILPLWSVMGIGYSLCVTPGGRLLRRSSGEGDRPALFAAQFALSHVCWLIAYPVAGQVGARFGIPAALMALAGLGAVGLALALWRWPQSDPAEVPHAHPDLPADHPHLAGHGGGEHSHSYVIDDLHGHWPGRC
jgi:predicted MFS family arabinose efflux permease